MWGTPWKREIINGATQMGRVSLQHSCGEERWVATPV
jgi:hypothetical protein